MALNNDIDELASEIFDGVTSVTTSDSPAQESQEHEPVQQAEQEEDNSIEDTLAEFGLNDEPEVDASANPYTIEDLQGEDYKSLDLNRLPEGLKSMIEDSMDVVKKATSEAQVLMDKAKEMEKGAQAKFREASLKRESAQEDPVVANQKQLIENMRAEGDDAGANLQEQVFALEARLNGIGANDTAIKRLQDDRKIAAFQAAMTAATTKHKVPESLKNMFHDHAYTEQRINPNFDMSTTAESFMAATKPSAATLREFALDPNNKAEFVGILKDFLGGTRAKSKTIAGKPIRNSSERKSKPVEFKGKGVSSDVDLLMSDVFG